MPLSLVILDDGPASGEDSARIGIPLRNGKLLDHVVHDRLGGFESERCRVADVELEDGVALGLHRLGLFEDGSPNVIEDIGQFRRLPVHVNRENLSDDVCYLHVMTLAEVVLTNQRPVS